VKPLAAAALALVVVAAGCGGGSSDATPSEDPSQAFTRLVHQELTGQRESSYQMLIRAQRAVVPRSLYVNCSPGSPVDGQVVVTKVSDEEFAVPELGPTQTKAVSWKLIVPSPGGGDPLTLTRKGHLIAEDGEWRWTLSRKSLDSFRAGVCP
jgi:hypothetical protein